MRVLAIALVTAVLLAGCSSEADFSGSIETVILPAEEYQQEIMAVDRLVFRDEPLGEQGVRELEELLTALSKRVRAHSDIIFIKLESSTTRRAKTRCCSWCGSRRSGERGARQSPASWSRMRLSHDVDWISCTFPPTKTASASIFRT
jgi:hypothetical protein